MDPLYAKEFVIFACIVNVIGILASGFNVTINLSDRTRGRSLNSCDFIIVALGISCTCYQCTHIAYIYISCKLLDLEPMDYPFLVTRQVLIWSGSCSFWFTSCLCVFYCVKIVDFNHPLFFCLKHRIPKMVPWLLLASVVSTLVLSIPSYWNLHQKSPQSLNNTTTNSTLIREEAIFYPLYDTFLNLFCYILPILLDISSITLILTSLGRHVCRMKESARGFSQPRLEAHFRAARMVGFLLLDYILIFWAICATKFITSPLFMFICNVIKSSTMPAQCIILLLKEINLKQVLCKMLRPWRK